MKPLVSILIPAYNAESWLQATLASAVNQDYARKEIILVNDGSTDRTLEIARTVESSQVKIINQPNAGGPAARNAALAHAQGDYLQWLDHDDLLAPDKISAQVKHLASGVGDRVLLSGKFGTFYFRPEKASVVAGPLWRDLTPAEYFYAKFEQDSWIHTTCWLVSRRLTQSAGPWLDLRSPDDDGEYFCRVVAAAERIDFVPAATSYWRVGNAMSFSRSASRSKRAREALLTSTFRCIEHFLTLENTGRSRAACVTFLRNRLIYFYPDNPEMLDRIYARARDLGGRLSTPPLLPQYEVLQNLLGWNCARKTQSVVSSTKSFMIRNWDRLLCSLSRGRLET